jgi:hypothetical protein
MNFELSQILTDYEIKKGGMKLKKNLLLWNYWANLNQTLLKWFEEISIFSNGGHLGYRTARTDTILKGDHLRIISAKFGNLLLWNYWANLNQTLLKWSLGGPLSKLCPSVPSCIQDGHHY